MTAMPCRTTQHCAVFGFCNRCAPPELDRIARRINHVIQDDPDSSHWSSLYKDAMAVLVEEIPAILKNRDTRINQAEAKFLSQENGACTNCGTTPDRWCETCASCPDGCYGGHKHTDPCPEAP